MRYVFIEGRPTTWPTGHGGRHGDAFCPGPASTTRAWKSQALAPRSHVAASWAVAPTTMLGGATHAAARPKPGSSVLEVCPPRAEARIWTTIGANSTDGFCGCRAGSGSSNSARPSSAEFGRLGRSWPKFEVGRPCANLGRLAEVDIMDTDPNLVDAGRLWPFHAVVDRLWPKFWPNSVRIWPSRATLARNTTGDGPRFRPSLASGIRPTRPGISADLGPLLESTSACTPRLRAGRSEEFSELTGGRTRIDGRTPAGRKLGTLIRRKGLSDAPDCAHRRTAE